MSDADPWKWVKCAGCGDQFATPKDNPKILCSRCKTNQKKAREFAYGETDNKRGSHG